MEFIFLEQLLKFFVEQKSSAIMRKCKPYVSQLGLVLGVYPQL